MSKQQIIITIGVSGSGKTTWSIGYIKKNPNTIRINRDDLRKTFIGTLDGYYERSDFNNLEKYISEVEEVLFINALGSGYSIIMDNTHLKPKYIQKWIDFTEAWNESLEDSKKAEIGFSLFSENNAHLLKKRINVRDAPLGWDKLNYIDKQISSLKGAITYIQDNYKNLIING